MSRYRHITIWPLILVHNGRFKVRTCNSEKALRGRSFSNGHFELTKNKDQSRISLADLQVRKFENLFREVECFDTARFRRQKLFIHFRCPQLHLIHLKVH